MTTMSAPGVWTWFTDERAIEVGGKIYCAPMVSDDVVLHEMDPVGPTLTSFTLHSGLELDDHDNGAILLRPDGRIAVFYSQHNDASGLRYRVQTTAGSMAAFNSEVVIPVDAATRNNSYADPFRLSVSDRTFVFFRSGGGSELNAPSYVYTDTPNFSGAGDWSSRQQFINNQSIGTTPYLKWASDGVSKIHCLITDFHPVQGQSSVYHFYAEDDGTGALTYHKSDGTVITAPFDPADATLVYNGTAERSWVWDITLDASGHPRALFGAYPSTVDARLKFSRWTGTEWSLMSEVTNFGPPLYPGEAYYSGGASFSTNNPNVIYLSRASGGLWSVEAWASQNAGRTWSLSETLSAASSTKKGRPVPVHGASSETANNVLWWEGIYNSYIDYDTTVYLSSADATVGSETGAIEPTFKMARVSGIGPSSPGTQDVTIAGFGHVDAVIAVMPYVYTANPSPAVTASLCVGLWDGTSQRSAFLKSLDGQGTTRCYRGMNNTHLLSRSTNTARLNVAQITGSVTDGVTLTWAEALGWEFDLIFISGVDAVTLISQALSTSSLNNDIALDHQPNITMLFGVGGGNTDEHLNESLLHFGVGHWDGSAIDQAFVGFYSRHNQAAASNGQIIRTDAIAGQAVDTTETWNLAKIVPSAHTLRLQSTTLATAGDVVVGITMQIPDPSRFAVGVIDTPATVGVESYATSAQPHMLATIATRLQSVNTLESGTLAAGYNIALSDAAASGASGFSSRDGAGTSEEHSYKTGNAVYMTDHLGSAESVAALDAFTAAGFDLDYSAVPATPAKILYFAALDESSDALTPPTLGTVTGVSLTPTTARITIPVSFA